MQQKDNRSSRNEVFLECSEELFLLCHCLVRSMTELGRGINPFEIHLLEGPTAGVGEKRLSDGDDSLLDTGNSALDKQIVVLDLAIANETTKTVGRNKLNRTRCESERENVDLRSNGLLGNIELCRGIAFVSALANAVDLVIHRGTVMVTHLTSASNGPLDVSRMPCANTSHFAKTFVRLARKLLGTPTSSDTVEAFTLGDL
jgi:hypothetical protein